MSGRPPDRDPRTAVCTIVSNNYLSFARTLMGSLCDVHPDWDRHVLITDEIGDLFDPQSEDFAVIEVGELPLPQRRRFLFRYTILELNTAVKPWLLEWLFDQGYDRVVYLDPDIFVYRPLAEVEGALAAGALICLTPHLTGRLSDDHKPNEIDILRAGAYNLGFIALARHADLGRFLGWWQSKMEFDCVVDFAAGLFVDQKWIDLAPGMYPDVSVLRHEGYNVGYWNLEHRRVEKVAGEFLVNGQPLIFFHFSGLDPLNPEPFSKHQDRFTLRTLGASRELVQDYCRRVLARGFEECRAWPYAWSRFDDGVEIVEEIRRIYRSDASVQEAGGEDPFALGAAYFNAPMRGTQSGGPIVTRLMRHIWEARSDLQQNFSAPEGAGRRDYVYWFVNNIAAEHALPEAYIEVARRSLAAPPASRLRERLRIRLQAGLQRLRPLARPLPPRVKLRLRRWLRASAGVPREQIRPHVSLGFGLDHAGFLPMDAYDRQQGSSWMGAKALVRLPESQAGKLRIRGEHHADLCAVVHGSPELVLRVSLDGERIRDHELREQGAFDLEVELDGPVPGDAELCFEASRSFVPAEAGLSADPRELSLRVSRIDLDGVPILDFARGSQCYVARREIPGFNIVGYVRSELGVGESARLCATAAEAGGIDFAMVDFSVGCSSRADDHRWTHRVTNDNPHPINLIHVNADQMPVVHGHLGEAFFENRYNIGFWHWELPELPDAWLGSFSVVNEVWVPSRFVAEAVGAKSPVPVIRMPHAISFDVPRGARRQQFGLPRDAFLFLTMYDMHSVQARKNPEAVLDAYRKAFPEGAGTGLVVKVMNRESEPEAYAELEARLGDSADIHVIADTLPREDVYALESVCDCFVSLHRSEGFGLGLAESMYLGKPVIGTNWSSNTDFMTEENSCPVRYELVRIERDAGPYPAGQIWADADVEHAAWYMRRLADDPELRAGLAAAGQQTIRTEYSPEAIGRRYRQRLAILSRLL